MEFKSRHILLIAYYWPPSIGPGVQRVKEMHRYFSEQGFTVTILTAHHDRSDKHTKIDDNVIRVYDPIPETTSKGGSFQSNKSFIAKCKAFIRGNFMIPDSKKFWANRVNVFLKSYMVGKEFDFCITSGPPQSCYLIGKYIKSKFGHYSIFDMRDPWTEAFFLKDFYRTSLAQFMDKRLEKNTLLHADMIIARGIYQKSDALGIIDNRIPVKTIYNGFVEPIPNHEPKKIETVFYTGVIAKSQIPYQFLKSLPQIKLKLKLFGRVHPDMIEFIETHRLNDSVELNGPVSHDEVIKIQHNADMLMLLLPDFERSEEIIPAKIFEYLASNRPIIGFGRKTSECRHILYRSGLGDMFDFEEEDMTEKLRRFLSEPKKINADYVNRYQRDRQFSRLMRYLKSV